MRCGMNFGVQKEKKIRFLRLKKKSKNMVEKRHSFYCLFCMVFGVKKEKKYSF